MIFQLFLQTTSLQSSTECFGCRVDVSDVKKVHEAVGEKKTDKKIMTKKMFSSLH